MVQSYVPVFSSANSHLIFALIFGHLTKEAFDSKEHSPSTFHMYHMEKEFLGFVEIELERNTLFVMSTYASIWSALAYSDKLNMLFLKKLGIVGKNVSHSLCTKPQCYINSGFIEFICMCSCLNEMVSQKLNNYTRFSMNQQANASNIQFKTSVGKNTSQVVIKHLENQVALGLKSMDGVEFRTSTEYMAYLMPWVNESLEVLPKSSMSVIKQTNFSMMADTLLLAYSNHDIQKYVAINFNTQNQHPFGPKNESLLLPKEMIKITVQPKKPETYQTNIADVLFTLLPTHQTATGTTENHKRILEHIHKFDRSKATGDHNLFQILQGNMIGVCESNNKNDKFQKFQMSNRDYDFLLLATSNQIIDSSCIALAFKKHHAKGTNQRLENHDTMNQTKQCLVMNIDRNQHNVPFFVFSPNVENMQVDTELILNSSSHNCQGIDSVANVLDERNLQRLVDANRLLFRECGEVQYFLIGVISGAHRAFEIMFDDAKITALKVKDNLMILTCFNLTEPELELYADKLCFDRNIHIFKVSMLSGQTGTPKIQRKNYASYFSPCSNHQTEIRCGGSKDSLTDVCFLTAKNSTVTHAISRLEYTEDILLYTIVESIGKLRVSESYARMLFDNVVNGEFLLDPMMRTALEIMFSVTTQEIPSSVVFQQQKHMKDMAKLYSSFSTLQKYVDELETDTKNTMFKFVPNPQGKLLPHKKPELTKVTIHNVYVDSVEVWNFSQTHQDSQFALASTFDWHSLYKPERWSLAAGVSESEVQVFKKYPAQCKHEKSLLICNGMMFNYDKDKKYDGLTFLCHLSDSDTDYKAETCTNWVLKLSIVDHLILVNRASGGTFFYEILNRYKTALTLNIPNEPRHKTTHVLFCDFELEEVTKISYGKGKNSSDIEKVHVLFSFGSEFKLTVVLKNHKSISTNTSVILALYDGSSFLLFPRGSKVLFRTNRSGLFRDHFAHIDLDPMYIQRFNEYSVIYKNEHAEQMTIVVKPDARFGKQQHQQIFLLNLNLTFETLVHNFAPNLVVNLERFPCNALHRAGQHNGHCPLAFVTVQDHSGTPLATDFHLVTMKNLCWMLKEHQRELKVQMSAVGRKIVVNMLVISILHPGRTARIVQTYLGTLEWVPSTDVDVNFRLELETVFTVGLTTNGQLYVKPFKQIVTDPVDFDILQPESTVRPVAFRVRKAVSNCEYFRTAQSLLVRFTIGLDESQLHWLFVEFFTSLYAFPEIQVEFENEIVFARRDTTLKLIV